MKKRFNFIQIVFISLSVSLYAENDHFSFKNIGLVAVTSWQDFLQIRIGFQIKQIN